MMLANIGEKLRAVFGGKLLTGATPEDRLREIKVEIESLEGVTRRRAQAQLHGRHRHCMQAGS